MTSNDYSGTAVGLAIALVVVLGGIAMFAGFGASVTTEQLGATAAVNADATAPAVVGQENNTTTVEQEDDTVTVGQEGVTTTVDRADDATANATSNYSTVGQLNESTLQEMSREELVDRILNLQQVLNQTEELYLSQIRTLHGELNETEQRVRELERRLNETTQSTADDYSR